MTDQDLESLLDDLESDRTERKESLSDGEIGSGKGDLANRK